MNARAAADSIITQFAAHVRTPLYRNGYALIFGGAASSALGFFYWIAAARYYPTSDVGANSAVLSAMMLLSGISQLGLGSVLFRFIPLAGQTTDRLISRAYLISVGMAGVLSTLFCLGVDFWSPALAFLRSNAVWFVSFVFANMIWSVFSLQESALTGLRQAHWVPIETTVFGIAKIGLLVALAQSLQHSGLFASWMVPAALTILPLNWLVFRRLIPQHIRATTALAGSIVSKDIIRYTAGNYFGALFSVVSSTLLPIVVTNQVGMSANAYFYLPWMIQTALQLVALNLTTSLTVEAVLDHTRFRAFCIQVLKQTWRLLVPPVVVILLGAFFILQIFGDAYAVQGAALLRLLALATIPNAVVALSISIARVQNRPGLIVAIQGSLCVLALGLSYPFLAIWGITGIGVAWLITQTVLAMVLALTILFPILHSNPSRAVS